MSCNCNKKTGVTTGKLPVPKAPPSAPRVAVKNTRSFAPVIKKKTPPPAAAPVATVDALPGESIEDKCRALAELLGLDQPAPEKVLEAAVTNRQYARRLLESRNDETRLYDLLNNPPESLYRAINKQHSTTELVAKAGRALLRWGFSGFTTTPNDVLEKREQACLACPNLSEPTSALQSLSASATISNRIGHRTGNKVCSVCGCVVKNKMKLKTETCPVENPETPGMNLWGEAVAAA